MKFETMMSKDIFIISLFYLFFISIHISILIQNIYAFFIFKFDGYLLIFFNIW